MSLTHSEQLFLEAMSAAVRNEPVSWTEDVSGSELADVVRLALQHHVLPMIFQAIYRTSAVRQAGLQFQAPFKQSAKQMVMLQTMKTAEFLKLYQHLRHAGVSVCVVKGIVCRSLYPRPDDRVSSDEDLLIPVDQFRLCHNAMLAYGMTLTEPDQDIAAAHEVSYSKPGSPLYIELHKTLFPPDSGAYGDFNRFFVGAHKRLIQIPILGTDIATLDFTDHFFYLICHAFKHFLHSGFGIRQVCDISLFANAYGQRINWLKVLENCRAIHAEQFTAALLQIGRKYLTFDPDKACCPTQWRCLQVDETAMLKDLLDSGVYGDASMSRKHSSNMTLNAVTAQKKGTKAGSGVLKSLFPSAKAMQRQYPYLLKQPYFLPVAWVSRILKYGRETASAQKGNNAAESVKLGNARIQLLKQYGVIQK